MEIKKESWLKGVFVGLVFIILFSAQASAQGRQQLTDQSIVKDSSGTVYPPALWKNLLSTGKYSIRALNPDDEKTEFLLFALSEADQKRRMESAPPRESPYFRTGQSIAGFNERAIDGTRFKLKDLAGKVVVLNFWYIACAPCQREIPELNKMVADFKDSADVVFIAICLDQRNEVEQFLEKKPFDYHIIENGKTIATQYGIRGYPTHVVLDKQGKVSFHTTGYGFSTVYWLQKAITKAMGS